VLKKETKRQTEAKGGTDTGIKMNGCKHKRREKNISEKLSIQKWPRR
jgi:hypothetical protein